MSAYAGPEITNSGLVLAYDMGNTNKSWKGAPATNLCINGEGVYTSGFVPTGWGYEQAFGGINPTGQTSGKDAYGYGYFQFTIAGTTTLTNRLLIAPVYKFYGGGDTANVTAGVTYTFSYNVDNVSGYTYGIQGNYLWYDINGTFISQTLGTLYSSISGWSRKSDTVTAPTGAVKVTTRFDFNGYSTIGTVINFTFRMGGIQWEVGSFATPYIPTTTATASRSTTQAILDPIGKNTITATSLTYYSNNTFSFNGTSGQLDLGISRPSPVTTPTTYEVWFKNNGTTDSARGLIGSSDYAINGFSVGIRSGVAAQQITMIYCGAGVAAEVIFAYGDYTLSVSHGVFIFDGRTMTVYKNGVLIGSSTAAFDAVVKTDNIKVANIKQGGWGNIQADIHKVNVYNRTLSANEVKQNFNALRGRFGI